MISRNLFAGAFASTITFLTAVVSGVLFAGSLAHAVFLLPGMSGVVPDAIEGIAVPPATPGPSVSGGFTSSSGGGDFIGTFIETVFSDPHNVFGAGDLTWLIQISNTGGSNPIERVRVFNFTGFNVYVAANINDVEEAGIHEPPGFVLSLLFPATVDRSASGGVIGFNFADLGAGTTSAMLEIMTDAPGFTSGNLSESNGGVASQDAFAPSAQAQGTTPLPGALGLFATGLGGLGLLGWRRKRKRVSIAH